MKVGEKSVRREVGDRHTDRILKMEIVRGEEERASRERERESGRSRRDRLRNRQTIPEATSNRVCFPTIIDSLCLLEQL